MSSGAGGSLSGYPTGGTGRGPEFIHITHSQRVEASDLAQPIAGLGADDVRGVR